MAIRRGDDSYTNKQYGTPKQYTLVYEGLGTTLVFPIPPQQVSIVLPERVTVTQTLNGIWADDFGDGIIGIAISGSFGWGVDAASHKTGKQTMSKLALMWHNRAIAVKDGNPNNYKIQFIDDQRRCVFMCVSPEFHIDQNQQSPLLLRYQMTFQVLETLQFFDNGSSTPIQVGTTSVLGSDVFATGAASSGSTILKQSSVDVGGTDFRNFPKTAGDTRTYLRVDTSEFGSIDFRKQQAVATTTQQTDLTVDRTRILTTNATQSQINNDIQQKIQEQRIAQSNNPNKIILVNTLQANLFNQLQQTIQSLPPKTSYQTLITLKNHTDSINNIILQNLEFASPNNPIIINKEISGAISSVQDHLATLLKSIGDTSLSAALTTISQSAIDSLSANRPTQSTDTLPIARPPLPVEPDLATFTQEKYSLNDLSVMAYGSTHPAYLAAITTANKFSLGAGNIPKTIPFARFPDRNILVDAPFDGSLT